MVSLCRIREAHFFVREADGFNSRGQRPRIAQRRPDPVRVEQVNSTSIVRHIQFRIHPEIELALPGAIASDDVLSA